ncbi:MAG TPA: SOS response-associated peptidase [Cyclobacteriaceae bacterium]
MVGTACIAVHPGDTIMIDRYSLTAAADKVGSFFSIDPHGLEIPFYSAAPAHLLPVVTLGSPGLSHFYWGTAPEWSKNKPIGEKIINIHAEQIGERPTLRKQLKKSRCIIPADGFYGWKKIGKKSAVPYRFELKPRAVFSIAGVWDEYDDEEGNMIHTFMMITVPSTESVAEISERMPAIMTQDETAVWMNSDSTEEQLLSCLHASEWKFESFSVSPRIADPNANDATMIIPVPPADQFGNLTLFS